MLLWCMKLLFIIRIMISLVFLYMVMFYVIMMDEVVIHNPIYQIFCICVYCYVLWRALPMLNYCVYPLWHGHISACNFSTSGHCISLARGIPLYCARLEDTIVWERTGSNPGDEISWQLIRLSNLLGEQWSYVFLVLTHRYKPMTTQFIVYILW